MQINRMRVDTKKISAFLGRVVFIGLSTQMVLGFLWMFGNLGSILFFSPYVFLLEVLLQIGLGLFAAFFFFKALIADQWSPGKHKKMAVWAAFAVNGVPYVMHCHLTKGLASISMSLVFLALGLCIKMYKQKSRYGFWGSLLCLGLVLVLFVPGTGSVVSDWMGNSRTYGKAQSSMEYRAMSRYAGSTFGNLYGQWPQELRDALTQEDIEACLEHPESRKRILGDKVEAVYGTKRAREIYGLVAKAGKKNSAVQNRYEILLDLAGHGVAPVTHWLFLQGKGRDANSEYNYEEMRAETPVAASMCVDFGAWWLPVGFGLVVIMTVLGRIGKKGFGDVIPWVICGCTGVLIVLICTMWGGGIMDYKDSIPVTALWFAWMCSATIRERG